ncbi:hypothetical protein OROHE_017419 [Orobanche hederae]
MKKRKNAFITSFFERKTRPGILTPSVPPSIPPSLSNVVSSQTIDDETRENLQLQPSVTKDGSSNPSSKALHFVRLTQYDALSLPQDPGKRRRINDYHVDDRQMVRREYIRRGPCQPHDHNFPQTAFGEERKMRRFNPEWFKQHGDWIEYSVELDAAFCFFCYLFKDETYSGGKAFVSGGFNTWSKPQSLKKHLGTSHASSHNEAIRSFCRFKNQKASISYGLSKQSSLVKGEYRLRLETSIGALRYLMQQGLPARGHNESETSLNRGNFLELLKCFANRDAEVKKVVLENAPQNCQMICPDVQKDIINCFANLTTKMLLEELDGDLFSILADESADIVDKEQLALCLRYVNKKGEVKERFLGIVFLEDTSSLTIKTKIQSLLMFQSLSWSRVRGQGYDGASNMQGSINGLKALILKESPCAYYIHCFAHQLQLTLIAVAKKNKFCGWLFDMLAILLNLVGGSPKRIVVLRKKQAEHLLEALESGECESGKGLNQELGLSRPGDTRWSSHFKTISNVLALYPSIIDVLDAIRKIDGSDGFKVDAVMVGLESFDFVFIAHLLVAIFGYTNQLNMALQKREQDIVNAMTFVDVTRGQLQKMRNSGWDALVEKISSFCTKYDIVVLDMDEMYVRPGKSKRGVSQVTNLHHFRVEVFLNVLDHQLQEIDNRFNEVSKELLICMSCFCPDDGFSSFDPKKLVRLAEFYPNEFSSSDLNYFEYELENFIVDIRNDVRFSRIKNLNDLSMKHVETEKDRLHSKVYLLLKLVLLLPVATASVERTFSAMTFIKNKLRNSMGDQLLNDCLVTF